MDYRNIFDSFEKDVTAYSLSDLLYATERSAAGNSIIALVGDSQTRMKILEDLFLYFTEMGYSERIKYEPPTRHIQKGWAELLYVIGKKLGGLPRFPTNAPFHRWMDFLKTLIRELSPAQLN